MEAAEALVPMIVPEGAKLNITWQGQNGDHPDTVPFDVPDADMKRFAEEAISTGYIPGIRADAEVNLGDFVVDRYGPTDALPFPRVFIRPKTAFGG